MKELEGTGRVHSFGPWKIFFACPALLFAVLAAAAWIVWRGPPPVPGLSFLGYTNKPFTFVAARVLFTNGSHLPLEILPYVRNENVIQTNGGFFQPPGFHTPSPAVLPRLVQPGQTMVLDIDLNYDFKDPWWIEVATQPPLAPSRLRDYAARIRQPRLRSWAQRIFPPLETTYTKLGPFTNLPPGWIRMRDGSARRSSRKD